MSIILREHNQVAYEKVNEMFEYSDRACIIHPTGTGKMCIGQKIIEENPDKKVLYLAPSNAILHQLKESILETNGRMIGNLKRMTYQKLNNLEDEMLELNPDIVILDEFHHCGAPKWGEAVQNLIDNNPNCKVLGLSATPIRYFDGNIDMAEKLFKNNIASEMSFEEAIMKGILPPFDYVCGMYGMDKSMEELKHNIDSSSVSQDSKNDAYILYNELNTNIGQNVDGITDLFEQHMKNKSGKYIVFCRNIDDMNQKIEEAEELFKKVNPEMEIYKVSSSAEDFKDTEKTLSRFKNDNDSEKLKLLFSVNILNEGFHLPDIDGVIMMRPTQSPTIYTQQIGRALSYGKQPVIIDLVDNFDSIKIIEDFAERMRLYTSDGNGHKNSRTRKQINVYDYMKETRNIIDKIEELTVKEKEKKLTLTERLDLVEEFCREIGEPIIGNTVYKGYPIGQFMITLRAGLKKGIYSLSEEQESKLDKLGVLERQVGSIEDKITRLETFIKEYPKIWNNKKVLEEYLNSISDMDERELLQKRFEQAMNDYSYIASRKNKNHLSESQISRLREAGVRGVFGYESKVQAEKDRLINEYGFDEKILDKIIKVYGSIDLFREEYIECFSKGTLDDIPEDISKNLKMITNFDISSPDLVCRNDGYMELFSEIFSWSKDFEKNQCSIIIDKLEFDKTIKENLGRIPDRQARILQMTYGLDDTEKLKQTEMQEIFGLPKQTISNYKKKAILNIRAYRKFDAIQKTIFLLDENNRKEFIQKYFSQNDIFYKDEPATINEDLRNDLLSLVYFDRLMKEAQDLNSFSYNDFVNQYLEENQVDEIIKNNNLTEEQNMRDDATYLIDSINKIIDSISGLDERVKSMLRKRLYKDTDYLKIAIEANIKNDGNTEKVAVENHFLRIEKIINETFEDDEDKKEELLRCLKNRKTRVVQHNKEYIISRLNGERLGDDEVLEEDNMTALELTIEELDLSARSYNGLDRKNIRTVYDWIILSEEERSKIRNLGRKSLDEISEKIDSLGITEDDVKRFERREKITDESEEEEQDEGNYIRKYIAIESEIMNKYLDKETREELLTIFMQGLSSPELARKEYHFLIEKIHQYRAKLEDWTKQKISIYNSVIDEKRTDTEDWIYDSGVDEATKTTLLKMLNGENTEEENYEATIDEDIKLDALNDVEIDLLLETSIDNLRIAYSDLNDSIEILNKYIEKLRDADENSTEDSSQLNTYLKEIYKLENGESRILKKQTAIRKMIDDSVQDL